MVWVVPLIALGVWWNSNTIAHIFIHRPFFRSAGMNRVFSAGLSLLLGIPQRLWRDRHLAHHARLAPRLRFSRQLGIETMLVLGFWAGLGAVRPRFFVLVYLPGYLAGLGLCAMQGYWEHAAGVPISHYGRLYNWLCFNDGYHAEHHVRPGLHWSELPGRIEPGAASSAWPPLLRWLDVAPLEVLEHVVLRSAWLQRWVLDCHRRAFQKLLPDLGTVRNAVIVGGGLFPRSALLLRELMPAARLTIVDANQRHIEMARGFLGEDVSYRMESFVAGRQYDCDLTVIPLCLRADRGGIYGAPPSPVVLVHDWIWRRRGEGAVISTALVKRLNLLRL